jgi:hypothetical protein
MIFGELCPMWKSAGRATGVAHDYMPRSISPKSFRSLKLMFSALVVSGYITGMNANPKRRLFRFSLRTLLILVAMTCVGFGWLGFKMRQAARQRIVVDAIRESGGIVWYDYHDFGVTFNPNAEPPESAWLRKFLGDNFFANVAYVDFGHRPVTDDDIDQLQYIPTLQWLNIGPQVTDAGLSKLPMFQDLEELYVGGSQVTDAGLVHLRNLKQLRLLSLSNTTIGDVGLTHLKNLNHLQVLDLTDTRVTHAGLMQLSDLRGLQSLCLPEGVVTDENYHDLQLALNCATFYWPSTRPRFMPRYSKPQGRHWPSRSTLLSTIVIGGAFGVTALLMHRRNSRGVV